MEPEAGKNGSRDGKVPRGVESRVTLAFNAQIPRRRQLSPLSYTLERQSRAAVYRTRRHDRAHI
jgi:hypothetical protein